MDDRIILDVLDDTVESANDKRVVCEHVKNSEDVEYLHLDYGINNELLVVQCNHCANRLYNDCDLIFTNYYSVVNNKELSNIFSTYYISWKIEKISPEDIILVCQHDAGVLEEVFNRRIKDGSN